MRWALRAVRCSAGACGVLMGLAMLGGFADAGNGTSAARGTPDLSPPPAPFKAPYIPAADREVLQEVPSTTDPAVLQMETLRAGLDANSGSLPAAKQLADAYIDYSRQVGDAHYAGYAEAVISPWVHAATPPAAALVTQATILQYRHQFAEARALLQQTLKIDPEMRRRG